MVEVAGVTSCHSAAALIPAITICDGMIGGARDQGMMAGIEEARDALRRSVSGADGG
jgi:hypothetical protein